MVSTGSVPKQQPEESQQQPCSYQEIFIKSEYNELKEDTEVEVVFFDNEDKEVFFDKEEEEVEEEIFFINLDNIDLVFFQVGVWWL